MKSKLRVLVSAYICEPLSSSEAEVGWQWASRLSEFHEIVVITRRPNSIDNVTRIINRWTSLRFEYFDLPSILSILQEGDVRHFLYYNLWQIAAYFRARVLVRREKFDLVHHLVYVNSWQPTYMAFLGIPFIFGPIAERARLPFVIAWHYGFRVTIREYLEALIKNTSRNYSPIIRAIYRKADRILVAYRYVYLKIRPQFRRKMLIQPAIGASIRRLSTITDVQHKESTFKVLYVGRFIYLKYPDIALMGFLQFAQKHFDVELNMIGGGNMSKMLRAIRREHPQGHTVRMFDWMNREEIMSWMQSSDVIVLPAGMVLLEAMSCAKPSIYVDFGADADLATEECGLRIAISDVNRMTNDVAEALGILYESDGKRQSMGAAGRKRVEEKYSWDKKIELMNKIYSEVTASNLSAKQPV